MQSESNGQSNFNFSRNQKIFGVIIFTFSALIILSLILLHNNGRNKQPSGEYYDSFSHETVSNPPSKGPDVYGANPNAPVYLGFDNLLDAGLTPDQLTNLKTAFQNYSQAKKQPIKEISIDVDHILPLHDSAKSGSPYYLQFNVKIDRHTVYQSKVEYPGLSTIHLYLFSKGKIIFNSGVLGSG